MDTNEKKPLNIASNDIVLKLVSEYSYTQKRAEETAQKLQKCDPAVQRAFEKWWQGQGFDEQLVVQDYTLQRLIEQHHLRPVGAFLSMDWLIREPDKALRALSKSRDHLVISPEMREKFQRSNEKFKRFEEGKRQTCWTRRTLVG